MPETNQDQTDFEYDAFNMNGKLLLKHKENGKTIELDFDIPQDLSEDAEKWMQEASEKMEQKGTKGSFTEYCGGEVTQACIDKAKKSDDPKIVKKAIFAENARKVAKKKKDFENKNLPKTEQNNIKNKIKDDDTKMTDDTNKDLTTDSKKIIDGQEVDTPAEGDDYEAGDKVKGDPYNETERYDKTEKKEKKTDMEDFKKELMKEVQEVIKNALNPIQTDMEDYRKEKESKDANEKRDLIETLSNKPYEISIDLIKDLTLEQLKQRKETYDMLPMIKDYFEEEDVYLTHRDVKKNAFDMTPSEGRESAKAKSAVLDRAKQHFITHDLATDNMKGEDRYKMDFGGAYD